MSIEVACPGCKKQYRVGDNLAGKKIRCKACDKVFLVNPPADDADREAGDAPPAKKRSQGAGAKEAAERPARRRRERDDEDERPARRRRGRDDDDDDDGEDERPPRKSKGKKQSARLVWALAGGGALVVFLGIGVMVWRMTRPPPRPEPVIRNEVVAVPQVPVQAGPPLKTAEPGVVLAIVQEFRNSAFACDDAIKQARDIATIQSMSATLRQEAKKMDQLTERLRKAGRAHPTDMKQLQAISVEIEPRMNQLQKEIVLMTHRAGEMKLQPMVAQQLQQGMEAFGKSMQSFGLLATSLGV